MRETVSNVLASKNQHFNKLMIQESTYTQEDFNMQLKFWDKPYAYFTSGDTPIIFR